MKLNELLKRAEVQYASNLPFVIYHKPKNTSVKACFQKDSASYFLEDFAEKGFVFAPFSSNHKPIFIPEKKSEYLTVEFSKIDADIADKKYAIDQKKDLKAKHLELVAKGIKFIQQTNIAKVVLSRKEEIPLSSFSIAEAYKKLLSYYPNAMAYTWFHPKTGLWMGATPETFLSIHEKQFSTMALAGTQAYTESATVQWQQKEKDEQQYVTDFITKAIQDKVMHLNVSEQRTVQAGNLLHLRTDITATLKDSTDVELLIKELHPTPAVCGVPKLDAQQFILENEGYDREFYTGFLGELNINEQINLFVNLRCMKVENKLVHIFVGGGITAESVPEKEWQETVAKSMVMKKIIQ